MTPAERAASIAEQCATRIDRQIAREWWTVTRGGETIPVFFCPAQTQAEVTSRWYPGAGVVAG